MPLTEIALKNAKPTTKPYKLSDTLGLFVLVKPNGSRLWRLKYRFAGKEKLLTFGAYPEVSLKQARERRDAARRLLTDGKDPNDFETIACEFVTKQGARWSGKHAVDVLHRLEIYTFIDGSVRGI